MNFEKLKETARKYEQKEEWRRAIEVYLQAIREFEAGNDPVPDLSVYNRIGDLYLKANEPGAAVQAYERAADLYGEQGFYNNAIALCGKILRVNPGRIGTYLKLAHLHARKNVVIEAKKNLLEYLERMNALNQLDDAFKSVKEFADQFPGNKEIRLMLSELLRASSRNAEAREQLEKLANDLEARGDTAGARKTLARLQALDAEEGGTPPAGDALPRPPTRAKGDLVFLDTGSELAPPPPRAPSGPASRKTRAITIGPPGRPTEKSRVVSGLPLIEVGEEAAKPTGPKTGKTPALEIETSSLVDTPLELESVQSISDEAHLEAAASAEVAKTLGFEPTVAEGFDTDQVRPLEGLELDAPAPDNVDLQISTEGLDLERASLDPAELEPGDRTSLIIPEPLESSPDLAEAFEQLSSEYETSSSVELTGDLELLDTGAAESDLEIARDMDFSSASLPPLDEVTMDGESEVTYLEPGESAQATITDLEDRVLDDPDDPEAHRALGEALLAAGEQLRGQEELELALAGYEGREDWPHASDLINELIRLDPNGVRYHQKRVEIGFRSGDRSRLVDSYLELADALLRVGAMDKALAVYRRVSEHDPGNQRALAALDAFSSPEDELPPIPPATPIRTAEPPRPPRPDEAEDAVDAMFDAPAAPAAAARTPAPAAPPGERKARKSVPTTRIPEPAGDFIDLGALILEDDPVKDTRMRVEDEEPTGDEQKDFNEMLTAFKRGIDENIDAEDYQAHYDLGVAFKEMGLLDEAIAEFQKALRSPEGRLKTSEALGTAFFEKSQFAIAEAILKRAVESLGATDDEQIGLIYWLGRAQEAQGKAEASIGNYQRVLAVEIRFMDVTARMSRLASGRAQ